MHFHSLATEVSYKLCADLRCHRTLTSIVCEFHQLWLHRTRPAVEDLGTTCRRSMGFTARAAKTRSVNCAPSWRLRMFWTSALRRPCCGAVADKNHNEAVQPNECDRRTSLIWTDDWCWFFSDNRKSHRVSLLIREVVLAIGWEFFKFKTFN